MSISDLPPRPTPPPSSLTEVGIRLAALEAMVGPAIKKLDHILAAVKTMRDEVMGNHTKRSQFESRIKDIERRIEALEDGAHAVQE